ncbi:preprotein translocase subunit SecG [Candidatus Acetothermia bacterium]|nr:preprotein translocase subunit SecG [Candidatus Acetothermia bacterium]MBI3461357.1 preprotein translocase subunit SecG [Candidatus Acetothermia bacterium]
MEFLRIPLQILFVLDAIGLVAIILFQMSRHSGMGGAFGAGGTYTVFGREEEADPKRTATAWMAGLFMLLAFVLAYLSQPKA